MGRKRRKCNQHLPPGVYRKRAGYIFRKGGKDIYLCKQSDPQSVLWAAYERIRDGETEHTLSWMLNLYLASDRFKRLSERTREAYTDYAKALCDFPTVHGSVFGDAMLEDISPISIRSYLDKQDAKISANRKIQFLKAAWNWAQQRHPIKDNPCRGVELHEQIPRDRYVTPEEFDAFKAMATGYVPLFMELAYLCRARWSEVAGLKHSDETPDGLRVIRAKGSEGEITAWTPRLRAAVAACKAYNAKAPTPITGAYLIHDKHGAPIKQNSFQNQWGKLQRAWEEAGNERFTYHDIKACGITRQKDNWGGHRSAKMRKVYVRNLQIVQPPD